MVTAFNLAVTDAKNQTTTYTYDSMDRLAMRKDALNRTETYQYDPAGDLTQFTDRKNQQSTFSYDNLNRRIGASYADGSSTSFVYDSVGRLARAADSTAGTIEFSYDSLDRLGQETTPQGTVTYQYDALSRRTQMMANGQQAVTYGYDTASRLTQVVQGTQVVGIGHDNANRRTSLTYPNGTNTSYSYDNASRLTAITHNGPSGLIESLSYAYDAAGNRISLTRTNGAASNLPPSVQAAYDAANEQIAFNSLPATFDANGNQTTSTDASGTATYTWDARNRLVGQSGPGVSASFQYDALGRRVSKTINGVTTSYLYDKIDIVAEISGGAVSASYLRSRNVDEAFVRQSASIEFYHSDAIGSTLALSNAVGTAAVNYGYEPFGKTTSVGVSASPFQYAGRENDGINLYYYRARYYQPAFQRFVSEDPLVAPMTVTDYCSGKARNRTIWAIPAFLKKSYPLIDPTKITSPYLYAGNNPLRFTDPMGLDKDQKCDNGKLFECEMSTMVKNIATCGTYGSAVCIGAFQAGGIAAAVPACSFAIGACTATYVFSEIYCLEQSNCL